MGITSKVRQSIVLAADGQVQKLVNTQAGASTATNITKANIMTVFAQSDAADGEIKLYNEIGTAKTAAKLIYHGKFGTADGSSRQFDLPGAGIYADTGLYADLTNCDFCYIIGTF